MKILTRAHIVWHNWPGSPSQFGWYDKNDNIYKASQQTGMPLFNELDTACAKDGTLKVFPVALNSNPKEPQ